MWWLTQARSPLATQKVLLSSAPQAEQRPRRPALGQRQRRRHIARATGAGTPDADRPPPPPPPARRCRRCASRSGGRGPGTGRRSAASRARASASSVRDRLVGDVAAGHHQRPAGVGEQQVVQRGVGEHHAKLGRARRDARRRGRIGPARGEHDRPLGRGEQLALGLAQRHQPLRLRDVGGHQRERLVLPVLARPQRGHRRLVVGAAGEVVAADALDREDRVPARSAAAGRRHRVTGDRPAIASS